MLHTHAVKFMLAVSLAVFTHQSVLADDGGTQVTVNSGNTGIVVKKNSKDALPPPQLGIAPPAVSREFVLGEDKRVNESLTFYNYSAHPKDIKLTLFDLDAAGKPTEPNQNTLVPWTLINPTAFTIAPNSHQTIRLAISPPFDFTKGEHRALLMIEQQIKDQIEYSEADQSIKINLGSRYGLPITLSVK